MAIGSAALHLFRSVLLTSCSRKQGTASTAADVQTSWSPSDAEKVLRHILDFMRRNGGAANGEGSVRAAKRHMESLEVSEFDS